MSRSIAMAAVMGPTMVAIGASEVVTYKIWHENTAPLIYLNGLLLFVAGLSILRLHNRWTRSWPVLITISGWIALLGGLFRMFAPQLQQSAENAPTTIGTASVVGVIGLVLMVNGYREIVSSRRDEA